MVKMNSYKGGLAYSGKLETSASTCCEDCTSSVCIFVVDLRLAEVCKSIFNQGLFRILVETW